MNNELVPEKIKNSKKYVKFYYQLMSIETLNKVLVEKPKYTIIDIDFSYVTISNYSNINRYSTCMVRK